MDPETREALRRASESVFEANPYCELIGFDVEVVGEEAVGFSVPYTEDTEAPRVAAGGIHGGILATLVDSVGAASVIAWRGEPLPLVTEDLSITFHDGATEDVVAEGRVVSGGSTLVTSRVDVYPESEYGDPESTPVATGSTTARPFE